MRNQTWQKNEVEYNCCRTSMLHDDSYRFPVLLTYVTYEFMNWLVTYELAPWKCTDY